MFELSAEARLCTCVSDAAGDAVFGGRPDRQLHGLVHRQRCRCVYRLSRPRRRVRVFSVEDCSTVSVQWPPPAGGWRRSSTQTGAGTTKRYRYHCRLDAWSPPSEPRHHQGRWSDRLHRGSGPDASLLLITDIALPRWLSTPTARWRDGRDVDWSAAASTCPLTHPSASTAVRCLPSSSTRGPQSRRQLADDNTARDRTTVAPAGVLVWRSATAGVTFPAGGRNAQSRPPRGAVARR